ncbi:MAG TPA: bifunctional hydroxymethylpyrimidine kinase/phosphomethylpyrimidine kinase [Natronosporangium sp.]|nr:bifunctional hydroxymethylpyrimidine kinase/phosphomethylpyrimidine kinase [Natronosporangium sp.]
MTTPAPAYPVALTVASTDSGGGAGIPADLRTFHALGVFGTCAVAATTAQNTLGVHAIDELPARALTDQIDAVASDIPVAAAKTGALPSAALLEAAADALRRHGVTALVVDPVAISKHGDPLLAPEAVEVMRDRLLPLAEVVTPNLHEVELLTGVKVAEPADQRRAAEALLGYGPRWVLVKGGHLPGSADAVDLLTDGTQEYRLARPRIDNRHTHGTGCTLSAAITAYRARGLDVPSAVREAKEFVTGAIRYGFPLGHGIGPVDVLWRTREAAS